GQPPRLPRRRAIRRPNLAPPDLAPGGAGGALSERLGSAGPVRHPGPARRDRGDDAAPLTESHEPAQPPGRARRDRAPLPTRGEDGGGQGAELLRRQAVGRSEERRVGKGCRTRGGREGRREERKERGTG